MNAITTSAASTTDHYRTALQSKNMDEKIAAAAWLWNNDPDFEW